MRKMVEDIDHSGEDGYLPCAEYEIGKLYMYHPGEKKRPYLVKLVGGMFWGEHGLSNHWSWKKVLPGGKLGNEECGYGGAFKEAPPSATRPKKAKKRRK